MNIENGPTDPWLISRSMRSSWVEYIEQTFKNRRCVFGTLLYPRKPRTEDVAKSAGIYTEQVVRRTCKAHRGALRRVFIAEQTPGDAIQKRVQPIPIKGEIRHLLIKPPRPCEGHSIKGIPDFPHIHFLMEVPNGFEGPAFVKVCEERWLRMNGKDLNVHFKLAKVEMVADLTAATRYITKGYVESQGENIILTHATVLG